jgi:hypothetical protein
MATNITPNEALGRKLDRRERKKRLVAERDSLVAALQAWKSVAAYNTDITNAATLIALYREERKALRDCMQALRVLISVEIEAMADEAN